MKDRGCLKEWPESGERICRHQRRPRGSSRLLQFQEAENSKRACGPGGVSEQREDQLQNLGATSEIRDERYCLSSFTGRSWRHRKGLENLDSVQ